ncbi:SHOCT domain-containing protein [Micromonospora sp. NPDC049274]|uniref:SHOCT domain-containing protein n=1 Tax=Micromonospora sp. NPDC049274 TaxID=3154829 RepID=UPI003446E74D
MSTAKRPSRRTTRPSVDEAIIRERCTTPEAADYTLYVRRLIDNYLGEGGQAQILRIAKTRGLDFPGLNRKKLSEQLSRYTNGPTWDMVELIVACLPTDESETTGIRALAAGWYQCARGRLPEGYTGPVSRPEGQPELDNVPDSSPTIPALQRKIAHLQMRMRDDTDQYLKNLRQSENSRLRESRRADEMEWQFHQAREALLNVRTIAAQVATVQEEYARQCVMLELIAAPSLRAMAVIDLPAPPDNRSRIRFGHLVATINSQAPPGRRALARYLCAYAELAGVSPTELAARTHIPTTEVMDILAGRLLPNITQAAHLTTVLGCVPDTVNQLTTAAAAGGTSALDESFWRIAAAVDAPALTPGLIEDVGTDPDNPATHPPAVPTTPGTAAITDRLHQLAALLQHGQISDDEYAQQRTRILGEL